MIDDNTHACIHKLCMSYIRHLNTWQIHGYLNRDIDLVDMKNVFTLGNSVYANGFYVE